MTTSPLRRTHITVVERIRERCARLELLREAIENLWKALSGKPELHRDAGMSISQRECTGWLRRRSLSRAALSYSLVGTRSKSPFGALSRRMDAPNTNTWEIASSLALIAAMGSAAFWLLFRKRPTAEELERARRQFLVQSGRLSDGM